MLKFYFHKTFYIYALILILQGKYIYLISAISAAVFHELCHSAVAYNYGYVLNKITLMPYGAVLFGGEKIDKSHAFQIAAAGPLSNVIVAAFITALWWVFPTTYSYTKVFSDVNITLALFNLLPVFPLDGGRMLIALSRNPQKTLKTMRIMGMALSFVFVALFIASAFSGINYSLSILAVMLFLSATGGTEKERYLHMAKDAPFTKNWTQPISYKTYYVSESLRLMSVLRLIKPHHKARFIIINDQKEETKVLSEEEVGKMCECYPIAMSIKEAVRKSNDSN